MNSEIAVLGNGLAANLFAAYIRRRMPETPVTIIGKNDRRRPIVGESTTEFPVRFFYYIGAGQFLEEKHRPKYNLTWYHKHHIEDPKCPRYFVNQGTGRARLPSYQINREIWDADLEAMNRRNGVRFVDANITDVELGSPASGGKLHRVHYEDAGGKHTFDARWVIDASGRRTILARKHGLIKHSSPRNCFWFRVKDFDPNVLTKIAQVRETDYSFDTYNATHHFYGRANWLWLIALASPDHKPRSLMSVGITWRPDLYKTPISKMEQFHEAVSKEHPILSEFVRSGRILDTNVYNNFRYETAKQYDREGWFLLGDAAGTYDPLFSIGMMLLCGQCTQIASLIKLDQEKKLSEKHVLAVQSIFQRIWTGTQNNVTKFYEIMHMPVHTAWGIWPISIYYYFFTLPMLVNGLHQAPETAALMDRSNEYLKGLFLSLRELTAHVAEKVGPTLDVMRTRYDYVTDYELVRTDSPAPEFLLGRAARQIVALHRDLLRYASPTVASKHRRLCKQQLEVANKLLKKGIALRGKRPRPFHFYDELIDGYHADSYWMALDDGAKSGARPLPPKAATVENQPSAATVGAGEAEE